MAQIHFLPHIASQGASIWIAWQNAGGGALEYLYLGQLVIQLGFLACSGAYRDDLPWAFARTAVYDAIWVTYVLCSDQLKSTFIVPFRQRFR